MNEITLKRSGNVNINGADVDYVNGFQMIDSEKEGVPATFIISVDAHKFNIEVGALDFEFSK